MLGLSISDSKKEPPKLALYLFVCMWSAEANLGAAKSYMAPFEMNWAMKQCTRSSYQLFWGCCLC